MDVHNIYQIPIKCTNTFHYKALRNLPKLENLVLKYAIWQPCLNLLIKSSTFTYASEYGTNL
jgi:hypothetical protein